MSRENIEQRFDKSLNAALRVRATAKISSHEFNMDANRALVELSSKFGQEEFPGSRMGEFFEVMGRYGTQVLGGGISVFLMEHCRLKNYPDAKPLILKPKIHVDLDDDGNYVFNYSCHILGFFKDDFSVVMLTEDSKKLFQTDPVKNTNEARERILQSGSSAFVSASVSFTVNKTKSSFEHHLQPTRLKYNAEHVQLGDSSMMAPNSRCELLQRFGVVGDGRSVPMARRSTSPASAASEGRATTPEDRRLPTLR
ncbi:MAG: hypothetical protein COV52_09205 [Gammaproteobacteria bacterium CG11_big_fil_rev_8_21_14_0_20_46_22]|nr:MAG: hypothetical protein COW05_06945 [Gammaproteobacteria bacterium CG12_big_fil_rev_8_21_14_0_65_46_12]PIR10309.1 MAG: hypothetical protein COV52_09205 [Gammaproteobacteria bacterium CG11_big_fil_rev_8_21_14_0_20_46_22]